MDATRKYPISVVIPARNMAATVGKAIKSALMAGAADVVVVDDASSDDTFSQAVSACSGGLVRVIQSGKVRAGVCVARNMGIELAREKLIVPLDADDTLLPDSLEYLYSRYVPRALVYGGWIENGVTREAPPPEMLNRKNIAHATWLFEKAAWRAVGGYDPLFELGAEDWALMVDLVVSGIKPVHLEGAVYNRAVNVGTRTDSARGHINCIRNLLEARHPEFFDLNNIGYYFGKRA